MLYIVVMEMLREMWEENKKLRDDFKKLCEKIEEENSVKKTKTRKLCVPPEVKVRATICSLQAIYMYGNPCVVCTGM